MFKSIRENANIGHIVIQKQIFAQEMIGILINDLLDLAKMENNQFNLTKEYFDLNKIIYESFQILLHMANDRSIKLKAEIDEKKNLDLIKNLYGDGRRYL